MVGAASMMITFSPRRHTPAGPLPSSLLQGLAQAQPTSLRLRRFLPSLLRGAPGSPEPPRAQRIPHPQSHSSPISFSLTLGGKLAIYGVPSDSGGAMWTQRKRSERLPLRGVTRGRSLPVPRTPGRGRSRLLLLTTLRKLWKASDLTTESNTDNSPWSLPQDYGPTHLLVH